MSLIAANIATSLEQSSWIRKMFEAGMVLKKQYGEDAVCDFSLGNPDLPAPPAVGEALHNLAKEAHKPFAFGYMPNGGFAWARTALATRVSAEQGVVIKGDDLLLSCGAAGALNALFRAVLEPGDEVIVIAPFFVEYGFYVANHQGVIKVAKSRPDDFGLDVDAIAAQCTAKTRAVIINSPNNPTGVVYGTDELSALTRLLERKSVENGRPVFLVADEPYRFLTFDGAVVPSVLPLYDYSLVVSSFSKNLSLAGERVGYICLSPRMPDRKVLMDALTLANRILGFVNPPVIGQHIMVHALDAQVDVRQYVARRDGMARVLVDAGYNFVMPKGAFYFFPQAPGGDDVVFCRALLEENVLAVPGTGFGMPGYFRLTFCVDEAVIRRSAPGFVKAGAKFS